MQLSIETYNITKRFGEEKAFKMIKSAGFDSVDYSFYYLDDTLKDTVFGENYLIHAKEIRTMLDNIGLTCNQAHAPFNFDANNDNMDISNENYRNIIKSFEIASILGAKSVVVHAIHNKENESVLEANLKFYKSFEPYLERFKIQVAIENLFSEPYDHNRKKYTNNRFATPKAMKEIIEMLDSKWFVGCLDLGHATITDIEPQDFIKGVDNKLLKALHVQDNDYAYDKHWLPFVGKINWDKVTKELKNIGYDGDITFEIFNFLNGFPDELIPDVLTLAEKTGRYIIKKIMES